MDPSVRVRNMSSEVTVFSDSDWAADKATRTSSSAGVPLVGKHLLQAYTRKQKIIARSSAEAELYAAALGGSEAKDVESMMSDLGLVVKPVLIIDAKATEHILHRHGIGKMKHIDVARLRLQDEVRSNRLESPPRQERRQSCGHRDEGAQQQNHRKACDTYGEG